MKFHSYDTETGNYTATFTGRELQNILIMMKAAYDHYDDLDGTAMGIFGKETALPIIKSAEDLVGDKQPDETQHTLQLDFNVAGEFMGVLGGYSFESEKGCKVMGFEKSKAKAYDKVFSDALLNMASPLLEKKRQRLKKNSINKPEL